MTVPDVDFNFANYVLDEGHAGGNCACATPGSSCDPRSSSETCTAAFASLYYAAPTPDLDASASVGAAPGAAVFNVPWALHTSRAAARETVLQLPGPRGGCPACPTSLVMGPFDPTYKFGGREYDQRWALSPGQPPPEWARWVTTNPLSRVATTVCDVLWHGTERQRKSTANRDSPPYESLPVWLDRSVIQHWRCVHASLTPPETTTHCQSLGFIAIRDPSSCGMRRRLGLSRHWHGLRVHQ